MKEKSANLAFILVSAKLTVCQAPFGALIKDKLRLHLISDNNSNLNNKAKFSEREEIWCYLPLVKCGVDE